MLENLKLEMYRGFRAYELGDLTRVNLLVGKNNCGKTSILEAIHFLVSGGDPSVLTQAAYQRGEMNFLYDADSRHGREDSDISHFFFGHRIGLGTCLRLSADSGYGPIDARIVFAEIADGPDSPYFGDESSLSVDDDTFQDLALQIQVGDNSARHLPLFPVSADGSLFVPRSWRFRRSRPDTVPEVPPVQFLAPNSLEPNSMRTMWDKVLLEGRESDVITAMRLLEPDLDSIHFLTGGTSRMDADRAGVLLGFHTRTGRGRVPLGSYGDGMRRLLALSLSLIQAKDGFLLIDEIDTGLHWTVMEDMWKLIVDTARRSSVQVFATTHSYDCIRGLASLVESRPDLAADVSIQKIEKSLKKAVSLDAEKIRIAVEQDIEVR